MKKTTRGYLRLILFINLANIIGITYALTEEKSQVSDFSSKVNGHYVNLFSRSKTTSDKDYTSTLQRLRLQLEASYTEALKAFLAYDNTILVSNLLKTSDFMTSQNRKRKQYLDLDQEILLEKNARWEHSLYRAYLDYRGDNLEVLLGRQQIPWGIGKFWTPTDVFNPYDPFSLEKQERLGSDAINIRYAPRDGLQTELVYAPQSKERDSRAGLRLRFYSDIQEVGVIAVQKQEDKVIGLHFMRNIYKAGLRSEATFTDAHDEPDYFRFMVNIDYTFANSLYLLGEYFYNGQGRRDKNTYQRLRRTLGQIDFLGEDLFGLIIGYDLTPLIRTDNYFIFNLLDGSVFINPEVSWSLLKNSELLAGGQFFSGNTSSEFGSYKDLFYLRWKTFF
jgi:hypothetical protein